MRTDKILMLWGVASQSKLTSVSGKGKIKIARNINAMRPIVSDFEEFRKDAMERLKPEDYDEKVGKARQWQQWSEKKEGECPLTQAETEGLNAYFAEFNRTLEECLQKEVEVEHDIAFEKLTEEEMEQYMDSNDFAVDAVGLVMECW